MASACTNLTGAERVVQLLKVDGYSASKTMGYSKCIKSRWIVDGYDWEIHLYPATWEFGIGYEYKDTRFRKSRISKSPMDQCKWEKWAEWVALKLVFVGERQSKAIRATFGCRLVDQTRLLEPSQEKTVSREFKDSKHSGDAVVVLIESHDLAGSGYLSGDSLAVECSITVLRE